MDINEYFDGEKTRVIYNDIENKLGEGYVFETKQIENFKQIKIEVNIIFDFKLILC